MQAYSVRRMDGLREGLFAALLHFANEVVCFYAVGRISCSAGFFLLVAFLYDALAFLPQALIGALADRFPRLPLGGIGALMLIGGLLPLSLRAEGTIIALVILSLGNACVHVALAGKTIRASKGRLSPSSLYVGAGAFGVISGKLIAANGWPLWPVLAVALLMFLAFMVWENEERPAEETFAPAWEDRFRNEACPDGAVLLLAVAVVAVRAYMGCIIPTDWNTGSLQTVLLFVAMGAGKMLGGFCADWIGSRRTAFLSIVLALPFLLLGRRLMGISLIGILLFSMTMPLTLGALVSVLPRYPAVAFGLTTVGLFLGTLPTFFIRLEGFLPSAAVILALSVFCCFACAFFLPKEERVSNKTR